MKTFAWAALVVVGAWSSMASASGWSCKGEGYKAKLVNSTTSTRTPAAFIVSHEDEGTLLSAYGKEITKSNLSNGVRYSAKSNKGDRIWGSAKLWVNYREGKDEALEAGDSVKGTLTVIDNGDYEYASVTCYRYLKSK